ncbi:MAG TPA: dihydrodipicolinate synthase family protein [Alphaproteobacteria bacterium]|nr:dihydrodipicolinate synthase family protein [Alphaproteobacteria bacterium]
MKDKDEARARLKGLFNITVTPFSVDGSLDTGALAAAVERIIAFGFDGLLIGGTYGEFAVMTPAERVELFRVASDVAGNRVPLLLCSADSDVRVARDLTVAATELGGIPMLTPPFVSEVTDEHIIRFFQEIAPLSRTGVVIYNAPGIGLTLSSELIERIADIQDVIGLKQGDLAPTVVDRLVGRLGGRIRLFCASDLQMLGPALNEFDGLSSTNSCALPELILESYRSLAAGDAQHGAALYRRWFEYREFAREAGQPQTVKAAMRLRGWQGGVVRRPLRELSKAEMTKLESILDRLVPSRAPIAAS